MIIFIQSYFSLIRGLIGVLKCIQEIKIEFNALPGVKSHRVHLLWTPCIFTFYGDSSGRRPFYKRSSERNVTYEIPYGNRRGGANEQTSDGCRIHGIRVNFSRDIPGSRSDEQTVDGRAGVFAEPVIFLYRRSHFRKLFICLANKTKSFRLTRRFSSARPAIKQTRRPVKTRVGKKIPIFRVFRGNAYIWRC